MKLNVMHTEASTGWGGQELRILTEMEGMARRGQRLHLLAPSNRESFSLRVARAFW